MERTADSTSSTEPGPVVVGRVVGAHGLRGRLRVRVLADAAEDLLEISHVTLGESETDPSAAGFEVAEVSAGRAGELRMALVGVDGRAAAEALRGRLVMVECDELAPLEEGEYYGYQLVGCRVEAQDGREIGTVRDIWRTGAPDVLVIEGEGGREQLIPAARELLKEVDPAHRRIVIEVIPGLLDPA